MSLNKQSLLLIIINAKGLGNSYFPHPAVGYILRFKTGLRETTLFFITRDLKIPLDNNDSRSKERQSSLYLPIGPFFTCYLYLPTKKINIFFPGQDCEKYLLARPTNTPNLAHQKLGGH